MINPSIKNSLLNLFRQKKDTGSSMLNSGLKKKVQLLTNQKFILFYSILIYLFNSINNYIWEFYYSLYITLFCALFFLILRLIVNQKNYTVIRNLYMLMSSLSMCLLCFTEGFVSGNYFYFFVFVIVASFIYDYKETAQLISAFFLIIASVIVIFLCTPNHSLLQPLNEFYENFYFKSNLITTAFLICLMSFILLKQNFQNAKRMMGKQKFLDAIYNTSLDAVFIVNTNTFTIDSCNNQSFKMFDVSVQSFSNKPFDIFFKGDIEFDAFKKAVLVKSQTWKGELICHAKSGSEFVGFVSVVPFMVGEQIFKKINILDITDFKKIQAELMIAKVRAENAMNTKSQFLSHMSHELRTPLNAIIGTSNLLLDETCMPEQQENLLMLKNSSEHMLNLVNDVLDYSKIEVGMMKVDKVIFNPKEFFAKINGMFTNQFKAKGVALKMNVDEALHRNFSGDETKLNQVMCNLISNALKFTEGGDVVVTAKLENSTSKKANVFISVKDSGIGISKKQQDLVFLSFTQGDKSTTRKFGGTGLGLSISKKIVELLKGDLKVNSKIDDGSEFYFTIPLDVRLSNKQFINESTLKTLKALDTLNVLIAEDNSINMLIARKFLNKWSIKPTEALNGREAIAKFDKLKHDVLLIDLEMPEMDGYETIAEIRKTNKDIPVIAFTAAVYENIHSDLLSHGFTDYIQKPFRPEDLHRKIAQYVRMAV